MVDNSVDLFAPPTQDEMNRAQPQLGETPQPGGGGATSDESLFAPPPPAEGPDLFAPPPAGFEKELEDRSFFDKPVLGAEEMTSNEIADIARKHGVNPQQLEEIAPYFGARMAGSAPISEPEVKRAVGGVGQVFGLGIPQKLYKLSQEPAMERALDDLQQLAAGRSSYLQLAGEVATPIGGVAKTAGLGTKLAAGAGLGAAGGFGASRQGEELSTAAFGAGLGAGAGGVIAGVQRVLSGRAARVGRVATPGASEEAVDRVSARGGAALEEGVRDAVEQRTPADDLIIQHIFGDTPELTPEQSRVIARAYSPRTVADLADPRTEVGAEFIERLRRAVPEIERPGIVEAANREVAETTIRNATDDFARDVFKRSIAQSDDPRAMLRQWAGMGEASGQGQQYAEGRLRELLNARTAEEYVRSRGIAQGEAPSFLQRSFDWLSDSQYVLRGMDEKWRGLGAEAAHKEINRGVNRMSFPREDMRQQISRIFRDNKRSGVDAEALQAGDIIRKVEAGEALTGPEQRAFAGFRDFFEEGIDRVRKLAEEEGIPPLAIKSRPNYVPAQLRDTSELRELISTRINSIQRDAEVITGRRYRDIAEVPPDVFNSLINSNAEHSSTLKFMHTLSGETGNTPSEISRMWKSTFLNPEGRQKLETVARAALEREDLIPLWARETNLYKLADKWTTNTLRHLYLRKGIDRMRNVSSMLHNLGADSQAQYVDRLISDLMGTRKGTAAEYFTRSQDAFHTALDRRIRDAGSDWQRTALRTVKMMPTFLQDLSKQIYPNLLGALNPRTLIMNLTQTFTKTLPEFGGPYGSLLFMRGAARVGGVRKLPAYMRRMEAMGLAPRRFMGGSLDYLDEGLARTDAAQLLKRGTRAMAEVGMKPYEWAESVNRSVAFGASEMMANDLNKGSKLAETALMRFPSSVRSAVERARDAGDVGGMVREIATHIVNSTQYQYNRASMSEYGRTMGPLFSAFSKWPTATLGQVVEGYRSKGALGGSARLAEQLVAPWVLLETADALMGQYSDEGLTDRQKKLFSSQGISQAAPIGTLKGVVTGDFFTPPVIDTALKLFAEPSRAADSEQAISRMQKAAENGVYMFAPGGLGGWIRFVTDDLVTLATGERPEGSTTLERAGITGD